MLRRLNKRRLLMACLVLACLLLVICIHVNPAIHTKVVASQPGLYRVQQFVDGDTIEIDMNGHVEKIRFIGVDTPETHKPDTPVQCYGPEAAAFTKRTIGQQPFRLVADPLNTDRDRYGRLLRYVYLLDGTLVNSLLVERGYGFYYPYFPFSKQPGFAEVSKRAQQSKQGLWTHCHPEKTDSGGWLSNTQGT